MVQIDYSHENCISNSYSHKQSIPHNTDSIFCNLHSHTKDNTQNCDHRLLPRLYRMSVFVFGVLPWTITWRFRKWR